MKIGAFAILALMLLVSLAYLQSKKADSAPHTMPQSGSGTGAQLPPPGNGSPLQWFPVKEQYVTNEGDPFLIMVRFDCADSQSPPRFELLPPTPPFAHVILTCPPGPSTFVHTLIAISPSTGDRGKYQVKLGATSCGAPPDENAGEILSLNVKVKRAR